MNKRRKHTNIHAKERERVRPKEEKTNEKVNTEDKSRDMNNHFQKEGKRKKIGTSNGNQRLHPIVRVPSEYIAIARKISTENFFNTNKSF